MKVTYILELRYTFCLFTKADCIYRYIDLGQVFHEAPHPPLLNSVDDLQLSLHYSMCSKIMIYTDIPSSLPFLSPFIMEVFVHFSYSCSYTDCNNLKASQKLPSRIY